MVLTKDELIASLRNEVRILLHLAGKADAAAQAYRPTPKQRSTLELLRYLTMMGPALVEVARTGAFDEPAWMAAEQAAAALTFEEVLAAIATHADRYQTMLAGFSDADFRSEIELFGDKSSRGAFIVNWVLAGCAAYRTQIFLYLKAAGNDRLGTSNLWGGVDAPA